MKRILTLILFFAFIILARAQSNYQQNLLYTYNSGNQTAELVFFRDKSYSGAIEIPETVIYNGITYRVTSIGEVAFANCSGLTSVKIPNSIVTIKNNAFKNCKGLKSLEIPDGVTTIGEYAFQSSGLESIKIANSVTKIGAWAFYMCQSLVSVQLPENITTIEDGQFYRCNKLKNINLDNIISIGNQAFCYMSGVTLELPPKVVSIGNDAFAKSQFLTVKIPSSVTSIGRTIFYNNINLTYIQVDPNNKVYDSRDDCNAIIETATNKLVEGCRNSDIPTSVTTIGEGAFNGCTGFGSSLMGSWTFEIPSNIETIEDFAFKSCAFSGLIIPSNVKSIGNQAFDDCSDLSSIIVDKDNTIYDSRDDCNALIETSSNKLIRGCVNTQIPNTVSIIGKFAFNGCYRPPLESIVIPKSVRIIEEKAFGYCSSLKEVFCYSEDVPETDASAFYSSSIESATLYVPESAIESFKSSTPWNTFKEILVAPRPKYKLEYYIGTDLFKTYELEEGETITPEVEPTKEGYTFSGWSEIPETMPARNVTIKGTFTINSYKLTYLIDGEEYKTFTIEYGKIINAESTPNKLGYTFSGWSEIPETMPAHDVTITGTFTVNKYKLTYMVDGVVYKSYEVEYGTAITAEDNPTKEGYTFSGWSNIPETMPSHDMTITGTFSKGAYKITYMVDGVEYKTVSYDFEASITPEAEPTKEGYTFSGWQDLPDEMPAHDVTISGTFTKGIIKYDLSINGINYKLINETNSCIVVSGDAGLSGEINIPNNITYGNIEYRITSIIDSAFFDCTNMTSITIPNSVTNIAKCTFNNCGSLKTVIIEDGDEILNIYSDDGEYLPFIDTSIETLYIGRSISYGGEYFPFQEIGTLKEVEIGRKVKTLGDCPFFYCLGLTTIVVDSSNPVYDSRDNCNAIVETSTNTLIVGCEKTIIPNSVVSIGRYSFAGRESMTSIEIPNSVTSIGYAAFVYCLSLQSVEIPNSMIHVDKYAFYGCTNLKSVVIPESINIIDEGLFAECSSLALIELPHSLTSIGYGAFLGCSSLKTIIIGENVQSIGSGAFQKCKSLTDIYCYPKNRPTTPTNIFLESSIASAILHVPSSLLNDYKSTYPWSGFGSIIALPKYKLTYVVDGQEYKVVEVEDRDDITPEADPIKEGYTFVGWENLPETMPAHDVIVTGSFSINKYTIRYLVEGSPYGTSEVEYGAEVNPISEPTKEGYTFSGWEGLPDYMPAHDVTVTGGFTINSYKLTYVIDGVEYKTEEVEYGSTIVAETPTKEGYTFTWTDLPETMPAHDVTVTGSFTINKYKIVYMVDGVEYGTSEVEYGAEVNPIGEPSKEGYTFSGWQNLPEEMPAHDVTVSGTFKVNSYKVTFMYGDNVLTTIEVNYGEAIELPTSLNSERYTLVEWLDVPDTMPAHDITIYADYVDGINTITADRKDEQYIQVNGMYTNDLKQGLNIIRTQDGKTRKVWVK